MRDRLLTPERLDDILDPFEMTSPGIAGGKAPKHEHVWKEQDQEEH